MARHAGFAVVAGILSVILLRACFGVFEGHVVALCAIAALTIFASGAATAGIQAAAELHKRKPELRLLMLSMHDSEQFLFEALKADRLDEFVLTHPDFVNADPPSTP